MPFRVVIRRPRHGWMAGLLGAGVMAVAGLLALAGALAAVMLVTTLLWWAGEAVVPVVVLVYGCVVLAGCAFAVGYVSASDARHARRAVARGPGQVAWRPRAGRVRTGLVWERDAPAITALAERPRQDNCQ